MNKNPRLAEALAPLRVTLEAERDAVLKSSAPLRAKRDALVAKIQPLEAELRELDDRITAIEQPKLREVGNELAAIARQLGATTLTNGAV